MDQDISYAVWTGLAAALGSVATVAGQWLRRDKVESEADLNTAQAEKIKADTMVGMYQAFTDSARDFQTQNQQMQKQNSTMQKQNSTMLDLISELNTCRGEITAMQKQNDELHADNASQTAQINELKTQVVSLMASKADLEKQVDELRKSETALKKQVSDLEKSSSDKDGKIEKMRERIQALEAERDLALEELEAEKKNGKPAQKPAESVLLSDTGRPLNPK